MCNQPREVFEKLAEKPTVPEQAESGPLAYPAEYVRRDETVRYMKEIHEMAVTGKSLSAAMGTRMAMPGWDDILLLGAQLDPMPLDEGAEVNLRTVIGPKADKPMVLEGKRRRRHGGGRRRGRSAS